MKTIKLLAVLLFLAMSVSLVAACSPQSKPTPATTDNAATGNAPASPDGATENVPPSAVPPTSAETGAVPMASSEFTEAEIMKAFDDAVHEYADNPVSYKTNSAGNIGGNYWIVSFDVSMPNDPNDPEYSFPDNVTKYVGKGLISYTRVFSAVKANGAVSLEYWGAPMGDDAAAGAGSGEITEGEVRESFGEKWLEVFDGYDDYKVVSANNVEAGKWIVDFDTKPNEKDTSAREGGAVYLGDGWYSHKRLVSAERANGAVSVEIIYL